MSESTDEAPIKLIPDAEDSDEWKQFIPMLYWLPKYPLKKALFEDVVTGLTLGIMRYDLCFLHNLSTFDIETHSVFHKEWRMQL